MKLSEKIGLAGIVCGFFASIHLTNQLGYYISKSCELRAYPIAVAQKAADDILRKTNSPLEKILNLGERFAAKNYLNP